jgi:Domain of unknown function (DUF3883)
MEDIKRERQLAPLPPVALGGVLVVPIGLIQALRGLPQPSEQTTINTQAAAAKARAIVMEVERSLGFAPVDRELEKLGYDIESAVPGTGRLRFIEVKGRVAGADTVSVTKNEILYSLNKPDDFILAMVAFGADGSHEVRYLRRPFHEKGVTTDFAGATVNFPFAQLLADAAIPS